MRAVEIERLSYTYLEGTPLASPALIDVSLSVETGEIVALLGETGAGKTTVLQFCDGLLRPDRPGVVRILGVDTFHEAAASRQLRLRVGMLLQRSEAQLIERLVGDDVAFSPREAGLPLADIRERVRWAMGAVGLDFERFKDRRTFDLSGGEKRKVALAGTLAMKPELLLLDEPTAGLDPESKLSFLALIRRLREEGTTIVMASTNVEDLPGVADRAVVMWRGTVAGEVPVCDLWRHAAFLRSHSLELPEVAVLLEMLRERGVQLEPSSLEPEAVAGEICTALPICGT